MKEMRFSALKSKRLKMTRGMSFEEVIKHQPVAYLKHHTNPGQKMMLFWIRDYIWVAPFIDEGEYYFLKTLYPSRKYNKLFQGGCFEKKDQADQI